MADLIIIPTPGCGCLCSAKTKKKKLWLKGGQHAQSPRRHPGRVTQSGLRAKQETPVTPVTTHTHTHPRTQTKHILTA